MAQKKGRIIMKTRVISNYANVDIYFADNKVSIYYGKGRTAHSVSDGKNVSTFEAVDMADTGNRTLNELNALKFAVGTLSRSARIQFHGFKELPKGLRSKDGKLPTHKSNKAEWAEVVNLMARGTEVGGKKILFDIISWDGKLNERLEDAAACSWVTLNDEAHRAIIAKAKPAVKAKAKPVKVVAKVEKPAAEAKAEKAVVA